MYRCETCAHIEQHMSRPPCNACEVGSKWEKGEPGCAVTQTVQPPQPSLSNRLEQACAAGQGLMLSAKDVVDLLEVL